LKPLKIAPTVRVIPVGRFKNATGSGAAESLARFGPPGSAPGTPSPGFRSGSGSVPEPWPAGAGPDLVGAGSGAGSREPGAWSRAGAVSGRAGSLGRVRCLGWLPSGPWWCRVGCRSRGPVLCFPAGPGPCWVLSLHQKTGENQSKITVILNNAIYNNWQKWLNPLKYKGLSHFSNYSLNNGFMNS